METKLHKGPFLEYEIILTKKIQKSTKIFLHPLPRQQSLERAQDDLEI
jgi:hypothetical protein